jgi:hypothetical protein
MIFHGEYNQPFHPNGDLDAQRVEGEANLNASYEFEKSLHFPTFDGKPESHVGELLIYNVLRRDDGTDLHRHELEEYQNWLIWCESDPAERSTLYPAWALPKWHHMETRCMLPLSWSLDVPPEFVVGGDAA